MPFAAVSGAHSLWAAILVPSSADQGSAAVMPHSSVATPACWSQIALAQDCAHERISGMCSPGRPLPAGGSFPTELPRQPLFPKCLPHATLAVRRTASPACAESETHPAAEVLCAAHLPNPAARNLRGSAA